MLCNVQWSLDALYMYERLGDGLFLFNVVSTVQKSLTADACAGIQYEIRDASKGGKSRH